MSNKSKKAIGLIVVIVLTYIIQGLAGNVIDLDKLWINIVSFLVIFTVLYIPYYILFERHWNSGKKKK